MQNASLWRGVLGVEKTVVEDVEFDDDEQVLVAHVRPRQHARGRCGRCGRRCRAMTRARADAGGEGWIWARSRSGWRPTRRGWTAPSTGRGGGGAVGPARCRAHLRLR